MTRLADIILPHPLSTGWLHGLALFTFSLHFLFVLLTLGTAILATTYYVVGQWGRRDVLRAWDREFLELFFAHKSLAIVVGVGPILLMQMGQSIPFLSGVNIMSPLWMLNVVFLTTSLVLFEWQHRRSRERKWIFLVVSGAGLLLLFFVPATFVGVLVTAERPHAWATMLSLGGQLPFAISVHWALRLLHVLGASVVVTAGVHYLMRDDLNGDRRRHLLGWMAGGLAFQFAGGVALFASVRPAPSALPTATAVIGVAAAGWLAFMTMRLRRSGGAPMRVALLLSFIVMPMLLTRQLLQDRVLFPLGQALRANAGIHNASLQPFSAAAHAAFAGSLATPYDTGLALYSRSCAFCHGAVGNGQGDSAGDLDIPPEDLTRIRMRDGPLTEILLKGIPGSPMPVFDFYLNSELASLRGFLRDKVRLAEKVEAFSAPLATADRTQGERLFDETCSVCHGLDGRGSATGRPMRPPPPDLTQIGFAPSRAFQIVTEGYRGTLMRSFATVPEGVRWAVVHRVQQLYRPGVRGLEADAGSHDASSEAR